MALITDPDDLSQGLLTAVSDAVWTGSAGASTTLTSAANLPTLAANDFFEVRGSPIPGNNGLYIATGSPTDSSLPCDKVDGTDPTDDLAEAVNLYGDNGTAAEYKSIMFDTVQKRLYLLEKGNMSVDGATLQAIYSFGKEEWKADADLIKFKFPIVSITPEQFELIEGWEIRNVTSPAIQSKKLIRTAGWSEVDVNDYISRQYMGANTLGTFEDAATDTAYYQLGTDPTDTAAATDFTFAGPVNESIEVYTDIGVPGDIIVTLTNVITSALGDFVNDGFKVGGRVTILDAEDVGNDGSWVLTAVTATVLTVSGTPLTNNADDTVMRLAVDNRNAVTLRLRVRDGDANGKTFSQSTLADIGKAAVFNQAERFPLANATDLQISVADGSISGEPWSEVRLRYLAAPYNREVDSATPRAFGIVIDVGTYSDSNGVSAGTALFESANHNLGAGEDLTDYANGTLIIHEGTDQGEHAFTGNPVDSAGTLQITLDSALSGSVTDLSFTVERATPLTADRNEIFEKVQYLLRQDADIDSLGSVVTGRTADELIGFIASNDIRFGEKAPTNPNGGGSGVVVEGFDANDTNVYKFFDNAAAGWTFPFVAAGVISFNTNLVNDSDPEYWMFFEYTARTNLTDADIVGPAGDTYDLESTGNNLPALLVGEHIKVAGFVQDANNGLFVVTVVTASTSDYTLRRIDGGSVGTAETGVTIDVDENPIDTPDAIVVDRNAGTDIAGAIGQASIAFDFDYDNNSQGGRAIESAFVVVRAIGLETGQFAEGTGEITRSTGLSIAVSAPLERNYQNA